MLNQPSQVFRRSMIRWITHFEDWPHRISCFVYYLLSRWSREIVPVSLITSIVASGIWFSFLCRPKQLVSKPSIELPQCPSLGEPTNLVRWGSTIFEPAKCAILFITTIPEPISHIVSSTFRHGRGGFIGFRCFHPMGNANSLKSNQDRAPNHSRW